MKNPELGTLQFGRDLVRIVEYMEGMRVPAEDQISIIHEHCSSIRSIEKLVREEVLKTRWWLDPNWAEKNTPGHQFDFSHEGVNVSLYSYAGQPSLKHLKEITKVLNLYSGINQGEVFSHFRYILLDNRQPVNDADNENQNGECLDGYRAVVLFPNAMSNNPNRLTAKISLLTYTLTHEIAHLVDNNVNNAESRNRWKEIGVWNLISPPRTLAGGGTTGWMTRAPERCITDYARNYPEEDFCDSLVALFLDPKRLDPEKRQFLQDRFPLTPGQNDPAWSVREVNPVVLPSMPEIIAVQFKPPASIRSLFS